VVLALKSAARPPPGVWQAVGMETSGTLIVLRGNSGSGKSTVARMVQQQFDHATCLLVDQDRVRRDMLREFDVAGAANIELIESIAGWGLDRGLTVVVEGILNAGRYQRMLERLSLRASRACFFAWDLEFDETVRRHGERPQRTEFSPDDMAEWYHGWQPLDFVSEARIGAATTADATVELIVAAIGSEAPRASSDVATTSGCGTNG
jgi:energy-coupling factor transporter ATP-binding protein EcfA2